MNRPRKFISYLLLTVVAIGAAGCKGKVWSKEEEIRIGKDAAARLESEVPVSKNPADNTLVEKIGQKLAVTNELKWPFTFKVLEMKEVNAFSLPGGPVYVTRGLLDLTEGDEDELASVIGHEMAHTDKRHVNQMYTQGMAADILIVIATRGAVSDAARIVGMLGQLRFSRDHEYEADRWGVRYAYKAGYDPNAMIRFFEKMKKLEKGGKGDVVSNNLRTHPLTDARIEQAKKEIAKTIKAVNLELAIQSAQAKKN